MKWIVTENIAETVALWVWADDGKFVYWRSRYEQHIARCLREDLENLAKGDDASKWPCNFLKDMDIASRVRSEGGLSGDDLRYKNGKLVLLTEDEIAKIYKIHCIIYDSEKGPAPKEGMNSFAKRVFYPPRKKA